MIVIRTRKRREASARPDGLASPPLVGRPNRPRVVPVVAVDSLPALVDRAMRSLLVSPYGQVVRMAINTTHGGAVKGILISRTPCPLCTMSAMPRAETNGTGSVAVLAKAMAIIDRIADEGAATPARLAELTGEPRSSVYRLLASLQQLELVEPGPRRGTFVLGLKLFRLGRTVVSRFDERQAALPVMERIHDELGETTFLCVRRGYNAVCIERIDGTRVTLLALSLGGSLPLHAGGASRALLAFEPEEFWRDYLEHHELEALTPQTPATRAAL